VARIKINEEPHKTALKNESQRDRLLREGRAAVRRDIERRFHERTASWRRTYRPSLQDEVQMDVWG
jgi:hypothetical protein